MTPEPRRPLDLALSHVLGLVRIPTLIVHIERLVESLVYNDVFEVDGDREQHHDPAHPRKGHDRGKQTAGLVDSAPGEVTPLVLQTFVCQYDGKDDGSREGHTVVIAAPTIHSMNRTNRPMNSPPNVDMNLLSRGLWSLAIL